MITDWVVVILYLYHDLMELHSFLQNDNGEGSILSPIKNKMIKDVMIL